MKRLWLSVLSIVMLLLMAITPAQSDAPVEEFSIKLGDIPEAVLKDAKGAVSIMCLDSAFMKKYHNKTVPEVMVALYADTDDGLKKDKTIDIRETRPLSGWLFDGTRVRRFPVVDRKGSFLNIVYDVEKDMRGWIDPKDLSALMPSGWGKSANVMWFENGKFGDYDHVDIFELLPDKRRKLYDKPSGNASGRWVDPTSGILRDLGNLIAIEQRNGFIRLGVYDPCEGTRKKFKWIRIRDQKGRLTVWPHVGLSC